MPLLRSAVLLLLPPLLAVVAGCYEGREVGDCFDGKDNDGDGTTDCGDTGCEAFCSGGDDDGGDDDVGDDDGGDDDGGDDDGGDDDGGDDDGGDDDGGDDDGGDDDGGDDDGGDDDSGDDDTGPQGTPIADLQQGLVPEFTVVTVQGAVVTTGLSALYSTCGWRSFFIQDPAGGAYSGIMVAFDITLLPPYFNVTPGDAVTVTGEYREYYEASEIILSDPADLVVTDHPGVPAPAVLGDPCGPNVGEPYEGVLIQVTNLTVTQTVADLGFGEFEVNGCLRVDDFMFEHTLCDPADLGPDPPAGQAITSITAPLHYTYKAFKLVPDGAAAFQGWTP